MVWPFCSSLVRPASTNTAAPFTLAISARSAAVRISTSPSCLRPKERPDRNGLAILLISGTASIDEHGRSIHIGDFRAQCRRTYLNITELLEAEGATWKDIVRTTCYLRDIERDYAAFNEERTAFFKEQGLDPLPA